MSAPTAILESKFAELLGWEQRKRREQILLSAATAALALAIALAPLHLLLAATWLRWLMPAILLGLVAPFFYYRRRWRDADARRALARLDRTLQLEERVLTAWELAAQANSGAPAALVFKQTENALRAIEPRGLLPRQWGWSGYGAGALFLLWFGLLWFDIDQSFIQRHDSPMAQSLAHKLREFARELQEKAKSEALPESLKLSQALARVAQKNLDAQGDDNQLKKELAGLAQKLDAAAQSVAGRESPAGAESQQSLKDLKAELEAARDMLGLGDGIKGSQELPQQWLDRLASLPQLKRQLAREPAGGEGLGEKELQSFLDRLEQQASGELDRRALIDAQQFLEQMMNPGRGNQNENNQRMAGRGEQDGADDGAREKNHSNLPGKEPGKKDDGSQSLPEFHGGIRSQVKGQLGDGDSSGIGFKGKPTPGKSELSQQEVVATYRRQAEQELNSERVPEALKETVRKYFLSLEESKK